MNYFLYIGCGYYALLNLITFIVYGVDKRRALHHKFRIPETILILLAGTGGSMGAFAGMLIFRHKIRKPVFYIGIPVILLNQLLLLALHRFT